MQGVSENVVVGVEADDGVEEEEVLSVGHLVEHPTGVRESVRGGSGEEEFGRDEGGVVKSCGYNEGMDLVEVGRVGGGREKGDDAVDDIAAGSATVGRGDTWEGGSGELGGV